MQGTEPQAGVTAPRRVPSGWPGAARSPNLATLAELGWKRLALAPVPNPGLFAALLLAGSLDLLLTLSVLGNGFAEANPAAEWVWYRWGGAGLTGLKYVTLTVFFIACHTISQLQPSRGRRLSWIALYLAVAPVAWTLGMLTGQAFYG
ncbi:MAG: DUF5658 family protein [Planctomycetota bacterium]